MAILSSRTRLRLVSIGILCTLYSSTALTNILNDDLHRPTGNQCVNCGLLFHKNDENNGLERNNRRIESEGNDVQNPLTLYHRHKQGFDKDRDGFYRAALGLVQLYRVYNLSMEDLSRGIVFGVTGQPLSADDFSLIGTVAFRHKLYDEAVTWLEMSKVSFIKTLPHTHNTSKLQQDHTLGNKFSRRRLRTRLTKIDGLVKPRKDDMWTSYLSLCRRYPSKISSDSCVLQRKKLAYGYWKKEIISKMPEILVFYDVISEHETTKVKQYATENMFTSQTVSGAGEEFVHSSRISKTAILEENTSEFLLKLSRRVSDITGLNAGTSDSTSDAEQLQVTQYPPGGVYEPHLDVLGNNSDVPQYLKDTGDRISTFLFYLQDVPGGGATVFPLLNSRVSPVRGSAVFWKNLHKNGSVDFRMLHAGCPVSLGEKWVAIKWIHERGQMFSRPCSSERFE